MYYRHGNPHKSPGKVFSQEGLTKQNVSNKLWTKGNACRTWLKVAEYFAEYCAEYFASFRKAGNALYSLCVVELKLKECTTNMKIMIKELVWSVPYNF